MRLHGITNQGFRRIAQTVGLDPSDPKPESSELGLFSDSEGDPMAEVSELASTLELPGGVARGSEGYSIIYFDDGTVGVAEPNSGNFLYFDAQGNPVPESLPLNFAREEIPLEDTELTPEDEAWLQYAKDYVELGIYDV